MDDHAVRTLARLLLYGTAESRRRLAVRLGGDGEGLALLVATARSGDRWLLRARALEALGVVAATAEQELAERILAGLLEGWSKLGKVGTPAVTSSRDDRSATARGRA